jgi:hypothetical protein
MHGPKDVCYNIVCFVLSPFSFLLMSYHLPQRSYLLRMARDNLCRLRPERHPPQIGGRR